MYKLLSVFFAVFLIVLLSFSVVLAEEPTSESTSEEVVTNSQAVAQIQEDNGFENLTDILTGNEPFFLHFNDLDHKYYLMVIGTYKDSWSYVRYLGSGRWQYLSFNGSEVFYYSADETDMTFEQQSGWSMLVYTPDVTVDDFLSHSIYNFNAIITYNGATDVYGPNWQEYKKSLIEEPTSEPTSEEVTSDIEPTSESTSEEVTSDIESTTEYDKIAHAQRVDKAIYTFFNLLRVGIIVLICYLFYKWLSKFF
jgi:hypothetical protein